MLKKWFANIVLLFLLVVPMSVEAARYGTGLHHYVGLRLGGAEAGDPGFKSAAITLPGAASHVGLVYELQADWLLFGIGVQAGYQFTRDSVADFVDRFENRTDIGGESYALEYAYRHYRHQSHRVQIGAPIYLGAKAGDYFYVLLGSGVQYTALATYQASADMAPQGVYAWSLEPARSDGVNDFSIYGFYPETQYSSKARYTDLLRVYCSLEMGSYIPLQGRTKLRVGAYCDYGFRLGQHAAAPLTDYSSVDSNPQTQSQQNLQANLLLNPLLQSDRYTLAPHNYEVGVRLTVLFPLKAEHKMCNCLK